MRTLAGLVVLLGLAVAVPLEGTEGPAAPVSPSAERLIAQLGDRSSAVREKASQALEALGVGVLPRLRQARDAADPEVRRRVAALVLVLENANLLQPKRVTLHMDQRPIREIVTELARQSGYPLELYPSAANNDAREKQRCTVRCSAIPFWEALDLVCREGGLALQRTYGEDSKMQLRLGDEYTPFVHHTGPCRLTAQGFQYNRGIEFGTLSRTNLGDGQRTEQLTFRFTVMTEPRLPVLSVGPVVLTEAVDDRQNSLLPPETDADDGNRHSHHERGWFQDIWVSLRRVSREAQTVQRVRGIVPVRLLVEQKPELVVAQVLKAKGQKFKSEQTELDIEDVKEDAANKRYEIKFTVRNLQGDGNDFNFYSSVRHRLALHDAQGVKYSWSGGGWAGNDNSVRGTFRFSHPGGEAGPPAQLVFYGWTTLYHRVAFEFKDLPLP